MKTVFVDSNVFLRFFTLDDRGQGEKAEALFRKAALGQIKLVTGPPVLFEVAWVLKAAYNTPRGRIADIIAGIIGMEGIKVTDSDLALDALKLVTERGQDFADAYIAVSAARNAAEIATFNRKHFEKTGTPLHQM